MSTGPIYGFVRDTAYLSNFWDRHYIWVGYEEPDGVPWDVAWLQAANIDEFCETATARGLLVSDLSVRVCGVERLFQAFKTDKVDVAVEILAAPSPMKAKTLGRHPDSGGLVDDLRSGWEHGGVAQEAMAWCLNRKFNDEELGGLLKETGYRMLVEGNVWRDRIWGACWEHELLSLEGYEIETQGKVWGRKDGADGKLVLVGENWLGRLLMLKRAHLDCNMTWQGLWRTVAGA